ncbi:hypothetical protein BH20ACI3_BH20ACI3_35060 [soil metagenome]
MKTVICVEYGVQIQIEKPYLSYDSFLSMQVTATSIQLEYLSIPSHLLVDELNLICTPETVFVFVAASQRICLYLPFESNSQEHPLTGAMSQHILCHFIRPH